MNIFGKLFIGAVSLGAAAIATGILMKKKRENGDAHYSDDLPLHEDCCGSCGDDCRCNAEEDVDNCHCNTEECADGSCAADQDASPAVEGSTASPVQQAEASDESENVSNEPENPATPRS